MGREADDDPGPPDLGSSDVSVVVACVFVVPDAAVSRFLEITSRAAAIYRQHGALDCRVHALADGAARYGTAGLDDLLRPSPGEQVFLVEDRFRDRAHQERVMQDVDADPGIDALFDELKALIDLRRVVRAEWSLTPLP